MPYLGKPSSTNAFLTTAKYVDYYEWSSIVEKESGGSIPAKWIYPQMQSPGVIWYWVNENDCSDDL